MMQSSFLKTVMAGTGFTSDSYDLFISDPVTNMLKALGPAVAVTHANTTFWFTSYCQDPAGVSCLPRLFNPSSGAWELNPMSTYTGEYEPRYQAQTSELKALVSNAAVVGSVLGQLTFGLAGDLLGRKWCFVLSSALLILGCLGSATASAGVTLPCAAYVAGMCASAAQAPLSSASNVYVQLAIWRFLLGFGVGGEYPLASTITSEGSSAGSRGRAVAAVFSMQGLGKLAGAVAGYCALAYSDYYGGALSVDASWRVVLAAGCIPNLLTLPLRWFMHESEIFTKTAATAAASVGTGTAPLAGADRLQKLPASSGGEEDEEEGSVSAPTAGTLAGRLTPRPSTDAMAASARATGSTLWEYRWTLLGTASSWFLLDVTFYGQGLLATSIVQGALSGGAGGSGTPMDKLRDSLLTAVWVVLIALPGYWIAVAAIDRLGRRPLQLGGFAAQAAIFSLLAAFYHTPLRTAGRGAGYVLLYGLTYLAANAGPNTTTFVVPSEAFPTRARSSAHGISAAAGKVGAAVGSVALLQLWYSFCTSSRDGTGEPNCGLASTQTSESDAGIVAVMAMCAGVSAAGLLVSALLTHETRGRALEDVDASQGAPGMVRGALALPSALLSGRPLVSLLLGGWGAGATRLVDSDPDGVTQPAHVDGAAGSVTIASRSAPTLVSPPQIALPGEHTSLKRTVEANDSTAAGLVLPRRAYGAMS